MFKKVLLVSLLIMSLVAFGCSSNNSNVSNEVDNQIKKIGILQLVEHPALDNAREGFIEGLKEAGWEEGKNIKIEYHNAQNDQSNLQTMSKKLVTAQMDLILGIATPTAIALANETQEIPVLFTAVTDPVSAKIVNSMEKPGTNVTGTTDMNPIEEQLELLLQIVPDTKKLGVIYNAGEVNSQVQVEILKEKAEEVGISEVVEAIVANASEVMQGAQSLVGRVDAIYVPTDNTVVSAYAAVVQVAEENKIPLIVAEQSPLVAGGMATVGIDYFTLGKQTAQMAVRILEGSNPADMPVESQKDPKLVINKSGAERLGVEIPEEVLKSATETIE